MALIGLVQTNAVCSGDVVDTVLCEGAQMRQSVFGGLVGAAAIIGTAILAGAFLIAEHGTAVNRPQRDPHAGQLNGP
ncbi:hypothetical protein [Microbacterium sp. NPDC058345]|uniref:hypothetical protein n=1 Tax=Microbacterium sp. NPDC058345 TaxID=3346455 RepID=UPI00365C4701